MKKIIFILNGANLNFLGIREPEIYGRESLDDIRNRCISHIGGLDFVGGLDFDIDFRQSNHEGHLIDWLQEAHNGACGVIINAAGFGHVSVSLGDALRSLSLPKIEVHLSNVWSRESFRHMSYVTPSVDGIISGFGSYGYILAIDAMINRLNCMN